MFAGRGCRYEFKVEHVAGGEIESNKFVNFVVEEQDMKGSRL
jgi:hypothetical protein